MTTTTSRTCTAFAALALLAAPTAALASHGADDGRAAAVKEVELEDFAFKPATVRITKGQTVVWKWRDGAVPHNVTFAGFASTTKSTGTFRHRFTRKGTFSYRCTLHANMRARVIVR